MAFLNNIPQSSDDLSDSQADLLGNFQALDSVYGTDHFAFSNATANNGYHNVVTTPVIVPQAHPATGVHITKLYNNYETQVGSIKAVGPIQYSRGENSAVPSPVTNINSTSAAVVLANLATDLVLDFTGLARAICTLYAFEAVSGTGNRSSVTAVFWTGTAFITNALSGSSNLPISTSGNRLYVQNTSGVTYSNVYWTLTLQRLG